jgi:DNA-binding MarR family transcriptional regulator
MPVNFLFSNPLLQVWMLLHQTHNSLVRCEEIVFAKTGLTAQQHAILMAISYIEGPATPTEIANWVDRKVNSITLIVDRMEKAGLVRRVRDVPDRRSHRLELTDKGKKALAQGINTSWTLIQELISSLLITSSRPDKSVAKGKTESV